MPDVQQPIEVLLTREQLVEAARAMGCAITARQLREWASQKIIPLPIRRMPPGNQDRRARALYPAWMVHAICDLLLASQHGTHRKDLPQITRDRIEEWKRRPVSQDILNAAGTAHDAQATIRASSSVSAAATVTRQRSAPMTAALVVTPRIPARLRIAVTGYASRFATRNNTSVRGATLMLEDEHGAVTRIPIDISSGVNQ